jgi:DNA repair exonuclease SbcCD ATPase subunit
VRILRVQLRDVRRHADLDLELDRGLTIVRGPNEAGKTTLQRAIELALTRKATSSQADLDALRRWDAPDDARPWVRIEFEQEDEDRTRSGSLEKSFRGAKGTVRVEYDGLEITDPALADQTIAELTGIPTEPFFRSTASIRHHEVDALDTGEAALRDRLQASISGADRGTSRARKKLDKALHELNTKGDKNPGKLKVAETAVTETAAALESGEAALAQLERDRDALAVAIDHRAEADTALRERRSLLEKARQAERLIAERTSAQERFERFRQAVAVRDQIEDMRASHPSRVPLAILRSAVERMREIDKRIASLKAMLAGEIDVSYEVEPPKPSRWRPAAVLSFAVVIIGLAIAAAGQAGLLPFEGGVVGGIALAAIGLLLAILGRTQRLSALGFSRVRQLQQSEVDRRLRGRSQLEQELTEAELALAGELGGVEAPDLPAAETLLQSESDHVAGIERLAAQLAGLVGAELPENLPTIRDEAAAEIEQKTGALHQLGPIAKEPRARERLEVEVRDTEGALERARDDEARARARVEANDVDAERVAASAERLAVAREDLAALQRRSRVYDATLRSIDAAERATMRRATRYLERRMIDDIVTVTAGRYRWVRVDDQSLAITLRSPESGEWVEVASLSQGTLDLVYLAARLGLVRLVTGDRRPPLLLDDPFVTMDDERARRAFGLLKTISRDFQVIYLTTSDRYDDVADAVRQLEGPTRIDDGPADQPADEASDVDPATEPTEKAPVSEPADKDPASEPADKDPASAA